eukprot:g836.t1
MSIPWRAARKPLFGTSEDTPGPSAYAVEKVGRPKSTPPYVAFHTTSNRSDVTAGTGASGAGVAPGTYQLKGSMSAAKAKGKSNIFRSKTSRFAPTAPGSSVYRPSTIVENPGPGNYSLSGFAERQSNYHKGQRDKKAKGAPRPDSVTEIFTNRETSAPSVPRPSQAFGYERNERGKLVLQDAPEETYTGIKQDTIGPAKYFEDGLDGTILKKSASSGAVGFGLSRTKRKVFEAVGNEQVGPGRYTPSLRKLNIANAEGTAAFLSKVPMAHETKEGPTQAAEGEEVRHGVGATTDYAAAGSGNWRKPNRKSKVQNFGAKEKRGYWDRHESAPFTSNKNRNPGPGTYGEKRTSFSYRPRKKLTTEKIGFDSSDRRPCLSSKSSEDAVGPGAYDDQNNMNTMAARLSSNLNVGATGAFGVTDQRFRGGPFDASKQALTPGPGAYDPRVDEGPNGPKNVLRDLEDDFILTAAKSTSSFRSKTVRFGTNGKGTSANAVAPDAGAYYTPSKWTKDPVSGRSERAQGLSFASSNQRFGNKHEQALIWGMPIGKRPGPGQYATNRKLSVNDIRRKQQHRRNPRIRPQSGHFAQARLGSYSNKKELSMTIGLEPRFGAKRSRRKGGAKALGPGAYNTMGSMVKKSFNVTYGL